MSNVDIIIVGAGTVGLTAAIQFANTSLNVALVETREFQPPKKGEHVRVSALNISSQHVLEKAGVWQMLTDAQLSPFRKIHVWDATGSGDIQFDCVDAGVPVLGHIVPNVAVVNSLWQRIKSAPNIKVLCPAKTEKIIFNDDLVGLQLANQSLQAKLIVGADGAFSWVRQQASIDFDEHDYGHTALIATIKMERPHMQTARQVFLKQGPLALLPLRDCHEVSIVWSSEPPHIDQLQNMSEQELLDAITKASENCLGSALEVLDKPTVFPLKMRHVKNYVLSRVALIGDAAHTIHPLAGQGVNLGIQDAVCLADNILHTLKQQRDIGRLQNLRRYERARKGDNSIMIAAMQGFKSLFASEKLWLKNLRNAGLAMTNRATPIKNLFLKHAIGD